ncbi:hypothetical protein NUU61_003588 [Penicillium alfredii]|uniref:Uncharacterized protein n=1 Tax=Penicillium alfredii TaxID=1506179 RepID=A0A9W9FJH5_9EURO|nr:uncharacterized protein NUU61_003588 [Penicillium alfredii]KAJ5101366.1 hypothetical protein NUU61_003588 [Penicillium alfredii]
MVEGEMKLEDYVLGSDPYRTTSLPSGWPYPLSLKDAPHFRARINTIYTDIKELLSAEGLNETFIPYEATKPGHPEGISPRISYGSIYKSPITHPSK